MEESECMMSRFLKPTFKIVPLDDVDYKLVGTCRQAQKQKKSTCVVIGINECYARKVGNKPMLPCCVLFIRAQMVWGREGKAMSSALIKSATLVQEDEDGEELGLRFATDLVSFFEDDDRDAELADVMNRHFIRED